jgi:hypothetical protein
VEIISTTSHISTLWSGTKMSERTGLFEMPLGELPSLFGNRILPAIV